MKEFNLKNKMKTIYKIIGGFVSTFVFSFFLLSAVHAAPGIVPANPDPQNPRTNSIFIYKANLGQKITDKVKIINNDKVAKKFIVYPTDSVISTGGAYSCAQKVEAKKGVGSWINLSKSEVEIPALSSLAIDFTITIPQNADAGENNGCLVVEEVKPEDASQQAQNGAILNFRTATRVLIQTPGEVKKDLEIVDFKSVSDKQGTSLNASIKNKGNVSVDAEVKVTLKDMFGKEVQTYGGTYPVFRDSQLDLSFKIDDPKLTGYYTAVIEVKYNGDNTALPGETYSDSTVKILNAGPINIFIWPSTTVLVLSGLSCLAILVIIAIIILFILKRKGKSGKTGKQIAQKGKKK